MREVFVHIGVLCLGLELAWGLDLIFFSVTSLNGPAEKKSDMRYEACCNSRRAKEHCTQLIPVIFIKREDCCNAYVNTQLGSICSCKQSYSSLRLRNWWGCLVLNHRYLIIPRSAVTSYISEREQSQSASIPCPRIQANDAAYSKIQSTRKSCYRGLSGIIFWCHVSKILLVHYMILLS